MGGDVRRKHGFSRCHSVDSIQFVNEKIPKEENLQTHHTDSLQYENEKKQFKIKTIRYKTFPKTYKDVPEDIWHWVPILSSEETTNNVTKKNDLYMNTLTYQDIDDLPQILLNKMR